MTDYGKCGICNVSFNSVEEMKSHFSSEEHRATASIVMAFLGSSEGSEKDGIR